MSFLDQNPFQSFAKKEPNPIVPEQVTKEQKQQAQGEGASFLDEYVYDPGAKALGAIGTGLKYVGQGWDLFSGTFTGDMDGSEAEKKWAADEKKAKENQAKMEQAQRSVQSTFLSGLKSDFQTRSPNKRVVLANQVDEATKQYSSLYDTIDTMDGIDPTKTNKALTESGDPIAKYMGAGYTFGSKDEYKRYLESDIIPAQQELLRRQAKYLNEGKGSAYAYDKAMEEQGSDELAQKISDFSNNLQADSNSAAIAKFKNDGSYFKAGLAAIGKVFDVARYAATKTGLGGPDIANEFKYTVGGAEQDAGEWQKAGYGAVRNLYELWDGAPSIVSQIPAFISGTAVESGVSKIPGALEGMAALSKSEKVIDFTDDMLGAAKAFGDKHSVMKAFSKEMLTDTMVYDPASQVFMGKGMTDQDIQDNMIMNLPINLGIGLMARSTKTAQMLAQEYDIQKTFAKDGTINLTQMELDLIKNGEYDLAQLSILNRNKVGANVPENLVNLRNITGDKTLAKNANRVAENVQAMLERVANKTESTADTHMLGTALADNLISANSEKTMANFMAFKSQQAANASIEKSMMNGMEGENSNKFWSAKVTEAGKNGTIDIDSALTNYIKANPEYSAAAQLYRKISGIAPSKDFNFNANTMNEKTVKRQLGKMLKDIYRDDIAGAGKLVEGERLSPVHVFSQGQVLNIATGEKQDVSKFFDTVNRSTYQKKALNATVLDDVAANAQVFEYFTKQLPGGTQTEKLLNIFNKKSFDNLSSEEVTLIRAALSNEMLTDLASRGKKTTLQALFGHPTYRMFTKNEDGTYSIALKNLDGKELSGTLGKMFKTMDEMSIVKYLADIKAQDEIITGLKTKGVKSTVTEVTMNHPDYLKNIWSGFSEMLLRKTTPRLNTNLALPKVPKAEGMRMMMQLQKAFPNIPIVYGKLPEGVKGIVSPYQGKLIIDDSKMSEFTSLHEFGHVWIMHAKADEKELYDAMSKSVKDTPYFAKVKAEYGAFYKTDEEFIDEAIAHAIEDSGARFLNKLERQNFIDKFMALVQSIFAKLRKTDLTGMTDDVVNKLFNTKGKPISEKTLAELDILQFTKEDFDKNSYFIRHIMQKISEDELFNRFAKSAKTAGEQEFIYQIINSMIKNTVPSSQLKSTVENYIHGFNDYIGLVNKDVFTEQYIKSEIAKLETSSILRSMVTDSTKNQSTLGRLLKEGVATTDTFINQLDAAIIQMGKNLGLKRVFFNGSLGKNFVSELQNTIDTIKNSDMSIVQKQKALIDQSIAYSNDFVTSLYEKVVKGDDIGFSYTINGKKVSIQPEMLYQMLQVMRLPEFAGSQLGIKAFLGNKNVRANLKKYYDVTAAKIGELNINNQERRRIVSQVPVDEIPANKNTVILVSESKNPDITYAEFSDDNGKYMTIGKFLESELDSNTNYLVSANFFARSTNNPEMTAFLDKVQDTKNVYPVAFSVVQSKGKNMVEVNGYDQLKKHFAIKYTSFEMPEFKFDYAPSVKSLSRLSENSINTESRKELGEILDGSYIENPKAKEVLEGMGANPVNAPTVDESQLIHSFGEIGKIGEMYRQVLSEIVRKASAIKTKKGELTEGSYITSDKLIITDDIKNEYLDAITGSEDLDAIYLNGKTLTENIDDELSAVDSNDYLRNLTEDLDALKETDIDSTDFETPSEFNTWKENGIKVLESSIADVKKAIEASRKETLGNAIKETKYATGKEAFDSITAMLVDAGYSYTKISAIIKTVATENPGWKNDILNSRASEFLPSFDGFIAARMASPLLEKYAVTPEAFKAAMEATYERVHSATFRKHYPENDTIIQLFLKSLQKFEVLDSTDDVFAIATNLAPDTKKSLHGLINNIYSGDFQKIALDDNTESYATSTFNQLYRQFAQGMKKDMSSSDKQSLREMSGIDEGEDGMFTTDTSVTTFEGNAYNQVMKDFVSQLSDYHQFELNGILPESFSFRDTKGNPLYESTMNLNVWATQPEHKVANATPANIAAPVTGATKEKLSNRSTMNKAYGIFNSKSVDTINKYVELNKFDTFEKLPFKTKESLQTAMQAANIRIQTEVSEITEEVLSKSLNKAEKDISKDKIEEINEFIKEFPGDQSNIGIVLRERMKDDYAYLAEYYASDAVKHLDKKSEVIGRIMGRNKKLEREGANAVKAEINSNLLGKILNNVVQTLEAFRLRKITDGAKDIELTPIFTMVTESGAKRNYYLNTINNSPIFRTLMADAGEVKFPNPLMQILEYGKYIEKKILEIAPKDKAIVGTLPYQGIARKIRKIQKLYGDTIGKETIDSYQYTNAQGEVISRYSGDDDNINSAKDFLSNTLATDMKMTVAIEDITGFSPIKVEGEGFDFKLEKDSLTPIDEIDYTRINPAYLDSYDFQFVYTDFTEGSKTFGQQIEAVFNFDGKNPNIRTIRIVNEDVEIPKKLSKIDKEFSTLAETATCEISSNLF